MKYISTKALFVSCIQTAKDITLLSSTALRCHLQEVKIKNKLERNNYIHYIYKTHFSYCIV